MSNARILGISIIAITIGTIVMIAGLWFMWSTVTQESLVESKLWTGVIVVIIGVVFATAGGMGCIWVIFEGSKRAWQGIGPVM